MCWLGEIKISRPVQGKELWRVDSEISYLYQELVRITVLPGMETDGASIPRLFWRLIGGPFTGRYVGAALIHDGLYASELLPREVADNIFKAAMLSLNVPAWKASIMFWAVRMGGGGVWKRHTKESIDKARQYVSVDGEEYL
ncbi:MAG: DUF1353 domain-containing protein [Candidatus Thiodiazotropha sp. (ex Monitilora ramsayi)]|nr:DUF1353 domain-containing protein [Candidatus Thiodiazotropha sp. (ex Monitilora ramsayi)]